MADYKLSVEKRDGVGKNKVDKLRNKRIIPGVLYLRGKENVLLQIGERELEKIYSEAGFSNIVDLEIDGTVQPALFKEVQKHPFKNQFIHVDFHGVRMDEAIRVSVPINLVGRDDIRVQPSVLMQILNEVEVECLPGDIPSEASIDVSDMQIGDSFNIGDLDIAKDKKLTILTDLEETLCTLSEPREEVIDEETEEVDAAEVPTVGETEKEEDAPDEE